MEQFVLLVAMPQRGLAMGDGLVFRGKFPLASVSLGLVLAAISGTSSQAAVRRVARPVATRTVPSTQPRPDTDPSKPPLVAAPALLSATFRPVATIEGDVQRILAGRCASRAMAYRSKSDETIMNVSDDPFRPLLANPDSSDFQPALEAYRRCLARKIAAIRATPAYALAPDTPDRDCPNCGLYLSNRALEIPRLRMIIGLTYLAPPRFADQDPTAALAALRQATADATRVVLDFRDQAQTIIDAR